MLVSDVQFRKAVSLMLLTPLGRVIPFNAEQPSNALLPILVTPAGMVMPVSERQLLNVLIGI